MKIFISAGDASGDFHAAKLIKSIKSIQPQVEFIGIGGKAMEQAGLQSIVPLEQMSVVGFWEVARRYGFFKKIINQSKELLMREGVDLFLPIDYPGFNLRLAEFAKAQKIPVLYYIAPQLWAWGKNRAKKLSECVDKLLVVFPFEEAYFKGFGIDTHFVGHPLLDEEIFSTPSYNLSQRENLIAFMPGSRRQEINKHIPIMLQVAEHFSYLNPNYQFGIAKSPIISHEDYQKIIPESATWTLWENSRELMQKAKVGVVKAGTSTLEAALCGMPYATLYKTSLLSYYLSRGLINLDYISLPNILLNKPLNREFIQHEAEPASIAVYLDMLVKSEEIYSSIQQQFRNIKNMLGGVGASQNAARKIIEFLAP